MKTLEQIAQEVAGKFCFAHNIGEAKNELQYVILTALQQREQEHEAQVAALTKERDDARENVKRLWESHIRLMLCAEQIVWDWHNPQVEYGLRPTADTTTRCEMAAISALGDTHYETLKQQAQAAKDATFPQDERREAISRVMTGGANV